MTRSPRSVSRLQKLIARCSARYFYFTTTQLFRSSSVGGGNLSIRDTEAPTASAPGADRAELTDASLCWPSQSTADNKAQECQTAAGDDTSGSAPLVINGWAN